MSFFGGFSFFLSLEYNPLCLSLSCSRSLTHVDLTHTRRSSRRKRRRKELVGHRVPRVRTCRFWTVNTFRSILSPIQFQFNPQLPIPPLPPFAIYNLIYFFFFLFVFKLPLPLCFSSLRSLLVSCLLSFSLGGGSGRRT